MPRGTPKKLEELERTLERLSLEKAAEKQMLEREIQSLKQKCESVQWNNNRSVTGINYRDLDEIIPKYSGNDLSYSIDKWIEDVEDNSQILNWTDLQTLMAARKSLEGTAKLWLKSEPTFKSWENLKTALIEEFGDKVTCKTVHQLLSKRKKLVHETYQEYVLNMKELGKRADLEDSVIIEYIIDGISDYESNKSILYGAQTFSELKTKMKYYEVMKAKSNKSPSEKPKPSNKNERNCFNCGDRGHISRECTKKPLGAKCFNCNKFGHIASKCADKTKYYQREGSIESAHQPNNMWINKTVPVNKMHKEVRIQGKNIVALIDTGSEVNVMTHDQLSYLNISEIYNDRITLQGLGFKNVTTLGKIETDIEIDNNVFASTVYIIPNNSIPTSLIIGRELLNEAEIKISAGSLEIKKYVKEEDNFLMMINLNERCDRTDVPYEIQKMIDDYQPKAIKETNVRMKIILSDEKPIYQHPRRLSIPEKKEVDRQIEEWLKTGIVQPSSSDFASPIVLVKKKNGDTRICVDYRKINKNIIKDRYPLPLIEDQIDKLREAKIFTTLDLKNGFFHVPVDEESIKYTSFVTPGGQYEFLKTPFGLCNSPAVFQRFINTIFKDMIYEGILLIYLDDLIIPSTTREEGIEKLKTVIRRAEEYGLEIKWSKCQFLSEKIEYLGYDIENNTIRPSKSKVAAVAKFPRPTSLKEVQSFLGLTGYFRKFIDKYSEIARPLSDLLKKTNKFLFGTEQEASFEALKNILSNKPVLKIYSPHSRTELHTDASKYGYGAILLQEDSDDGKLHPIFYFSRKTSPAEQKYTSYELEVLSIIESLKRFRVYLLGIHFKIVTDCSAFQMTMKKKDLTTRVARWALLLEEFDYIIEHRSGIRLKHADALSRNPIMIIENSVTSRIRSAQEQDEELQVIKKLIETTPYQNYLLEHELLYKQVEDRNLLVIPRKMQNEIIKKAHENGHFGTKKTEDIILREFWIPKLKEKISNIIKNCIPCILAEKKIGKQEGFLSPIDKGDVPLSTYHIDHLGPLASTKKGYQYILTVVDGFTKFVWLYPTKTTTTQETLEKLEMQATIFGDPRRVISDRGTAFSSAAFQQYCQERNIGHVLITTGVPRGNGQAERINRIIIPALTKLSLGDEQGWYKHIGKLQKFINSTFQRSINRSPFEVMIGVKMNNAQNIKIQEIIAEEVVKLFEEEREEIRTEAKKSILKIQEENAKTYNKKRKPAHAYRVGDLVAIKRTQFATTAKIKPKFSGPYRVVAAMGHDRYKVMKTGSGDGPLRTSSSADQMKPWCPGEDESSSESDEIQDGRDVGLSGPITRARSRNI